MEIDENLHNILRTRESYVDASDGWHKAYISKQYIVPFNQFEQIQTWLCDNCKGNWRFSKFAKDKIFFENKEDQTLFLITWS